MGRTFVLSSLIIVLLLSLSAALIPGNWMLALYSNSPYYQYLRVVLVAFLVLQFVVPVPRPDWFAALSIVVSAFLIGWTVQASLNYKMELLDTLAFLEAGLATAIVSVELSTVTFRQVAIEVLFRVRHVSEPRKLAAAWVQMYALRAVASLSSLLNTSISGHHRQSLGKR